MVPGFERYLTKYMIMQCTTIWGIQTGVKSSSDPSLEVTRSLTHVDVGPVVHQLILTCYLRAEWRSHIVYMYLVMRHSRS